MKENKNYKKDIPRLELSSGPLKLMVIMSKAGESREEGIELSIGGADDGDRWDHVTKHHIGKLLQIWKSEVLDAGESRREKRAECWTTTKR